MQNDSLYLDLTTYTDIYQELVYQRNETIRWLESHHLLDRNRQVDESDKDEWRRHQTASSYRAPFRRRMLVLFDRLYLHDTIEAVYDFNAVELGDWTNTEANMLERELQRLQAIISKLETRYHLQYQLIFEYISEECSLYLNSVEVFSCGRTTLRHRLLTALFSEPQKLWTNDDIEKYFIDNFEYVLYQLSGDKVEKAAKDIQKDVASKTAVRDFLIAKNDSVVIKPTYLS